jgi:hypothetical protein
MGAATRRLNLAFVAILTLGCGGLGSSAKGPDAGASFGTGVVADFVNAYLPALCQYDVACHIEADVDGCRADISAYWANYIRTLQGEIDSGRVSYNQDRASDCLNAIQTAPCPASSNGWKPFGFGCRGDFQGTIATGEACFSDLECASGHCRWSMWDVDNCTSSCCPGTCAPLVDVGANCFTYDYSSDCVDTDYCKGPYFVSNGTCQSKLAQGETCSRSAEEPCQVGLTCDNDLLTCVPFPKDGQPCTAYSCDNFDSYCDPTRGTCQARLKVGAPCANYGDPGCVGYAQCLNGTCALMPGAGEACAIPEGGYAYTVCRLGATQCIDGICQEPAFRPPCTVEAAQPQDAGALD